MEDFATHPALRKILEDTVSLAVLAFKSAVQREGKITTAELLNSIEAGAVEPGKDFIKGTVYFSELLRIKDMKVLNYTTIPPLAPLIKWVEARGVNSFPVVPGYPPGIRPASYTETVYRIAEGVRWHLKSFPNVERGYRGIYNEELKGTILPALYSAMRNFAVQYAAAAYAQEFGTVPLNMTDFAIIGDGRQQAGLNARDTKLARKYATKINL